MCFGSKNKSAPPPPAAPPPASDRPLPDDPPARFVDDPSTGRGNSFGTGAPPATDQVGLNIPGS